MEGDWLLGKRLHLNLNISMSGKSRYRKPRTEGDRN